MIFGGQDEIYTILLPYAIFLLLLAVFSRSEGSQVRNLNAMTAQPADTVDPYVRAQIFWKSFAAERSGDGKEIKITWETSVERHIDSIILWKSHSAENDIWHRVQAFEGAENSDTLRCYEVRDPNMNAINMYRLQQLDYDGKSLFTSAIYLLVQSKLEQVNWINPITDVLEIRGEGMEGEINELEVFNAEGKRIYSEESSSFCVSTAQWPIGYYYVVLRTAYEVVTKKILRTANRFE